jgi:hypothetical protein
MARKARLIRIHCDSSSMCHHTRFLQPPSAFIHGFTISLWALRVTVLSNPRNIHNTFIDDLVGVVPPLWDHLPPSSLCLFVHEDGRCSLLRVSGASSDSRNDLSAKASTRVGRHDLRQRWTRWCFDENGLHSTCQGSTRGELLFQRGTCEERPRTDLPGNEPTLHLYRVASTGDIEQIFRRLTQ